jgi:uncharacterized protein YjbI with pentapeptide repeats
MTIASRAEARFASQSELHLYSPSPLAWRLGHGGFERRKNMTPAEIKLVLESHRKWSREEKGGKRAKLSSADLRYAKLSSANLSYADLRYAKLSSADLSYADLSYADLRYAKLSSADLRSAKLRSADLRYAKLSYAKLSSAKLSSADLRYAKLSYAKLSSADLRYAKLSSANLSYADLRYAKLRSADLRYAKLSYAKLSSADLRYAKLSSANLSYADLRYAKNIEFINFPSIKMLASFELDELSDALTLELMRRDAWAHPKPELFDAWASGGDCPYKNEDRFWLFQLKKELWKPGPPEMRDSDLILAICRECGWKITEYSEKEDKRD